MARQSRSTRRRRDRYWQQTQRPLNSLLFILPPLVFFQVFAALYGTELLAAPYDIGRILRYFGATSPYLPPVLILVILLLQHAFRRDRWHWRPEVLAGMAGESVLWAIPLIGMSLVAGHVVAQTATAAAPGPSGFQLVLGAIGAGIYEEFLFRIVLVGLPTLLFVDLLSLREDYVRQAAVLASAVLFSLYHFTAFGGAEPFAWGKCLFLVVAGWYWGQLLLHRGFGIAAGCHVLWDIYVLAANG